MYGEFLFFLLFCSPSVKFIVVISCLCQIPKKYNTNGTPQVLLIPTDIHWGSRNRWVVEVGEA